MNTQDQADFLGQTEYQLYAAALDALRLGIDVAKIVAEAAAKIEAEGGAK